MLSGAALHPLGQFAGTRGTPASLASLGTTPVNTKRGLQFQGSKCGNPQVGLECSALNRNLTKTCSLRTMVHMPQEPAALPAQPPSLGARRFRPRHRPQIGAPER